MVMMMTMMMATGVVMMEREMKRTVSVVLLSTLEASEST
jgi:hypothetical protein